MFNKLECKCKSTCLLLFSPDAHYGVVNTNVIVLFIYDIQVTISAELEHHRLYVTAII
jgi:hypothetical protein